MAKANFTPDSACKCVRFHRESSDGAARIFVEVREGNEHTIYISNNGITPSYLNISYDQWCRSKLVESYVFASLDSAMTYFQNRGTAMAKHLMEAIAEQIRL